MIHANIFCFNFKALKSLFFWFSIFNFINVEKRSEEKKKFTQGKLFSSIFQMDFSSCFTSKTAFDLSFHCSAMPPSFITAANLLTLALWVLFSVISDRLLEEALWMRMITIMKKHLQRLISVYCLVRLIIFHFTLVQKHCVSFPLKWWIRITDGCSKPSVRKNKVIVCYHKVQH